MCAALVGCCCGLHALGADGGRRAAQRVGAALGSAAIGASARLGKQRRKVRLSVSELNQQAPVQRRFVQGRG